MSGPGRPSRRALLRGLPLWMLALLGLLGGGGVGLLVAGVIDAARDEPVGKVSLRPAAEAAAAEQAEGREAFLAAWRRYREATYRAELVFVRVAPDGRELRSTSTYTQQPPRRAIRSADALQLDAGPESLTCSTVNGAFVCAPGPAIDYAGSVDEELRVWRTALDGESPWYRITRPVEQCYELTLTRVLVDAPYGDTARFCFDADTGALAKRQIVRTSATDTEEALSVTTKIPPDAFAPPPTTR
jgi:hypothetical protein